MQAFVIVCGLLLGIFIGAVGLAAAAQPLGEGWQAIIASPWSVVTLMDLSLGLLFVACWIAVVESRRSHAIGWIAALVLLGNAATLAYLLFRSCRARTFRDLFLPMDKAE